MLLPAIVLMNACGGGNTKDENASEPQKTSQPDPTPQPIELVVFGQPADPENVFNVRIGDAVRKKFPHITLKYIPRSSAATLQNLITSGSQVDLVYDSIGGANASVLAMQSQFDITELTKKKGIDLNRFDQAQVEAVTQFGGLYGLPTQTGGLVMYINRDVFDKFGVSYPKNGMTWDEAIELGNRLTRNEGGVQYIGLGLSNNHALLMNSLSLPFVDKKTEKPAINNDNYKKLMETLIMKPAQADGYKQYITSIKRAFNNNDFMKDRRMGMFVMNYGLQDQGDFKEFNWDMAPLPVFPEKPGIGSQPYPNILFVNSTSKYKEQAVEVLGYLTSNEYQLDMSKKGFAPVLKDETIRKAFGQEVSYKDKNIVNALFYNKFAPSAAKTKYDSAVNSALTKQILLLVGGETDINSALRAADEEAAKSIETMKTQQK
jgi:multiple sugar transport system substrate-binding protein